MFTSLAGASLLASLHATAEIVARLSPDTRVALVGLIDRLALLKNWDAFMDATGLAETTRRKYRYWALRFISDTLVPLEIATEDDVIDYLSTFPAKGDARGQILRPLHHFYSWAVGGELLDHNPVKRLKVKKKKYGSAPFLTEEELTRIVVAAAWRDERRAWAILFLYSTGARLQSACEVREEDLRGGWVKFRVAKGDSPYSVPLGRLAREAVEGLRTAPRIKRSGENKRGTLLGCGPSTLWSWVQRASQDSHVKAWPHLFRHTMATHVLERSPATDIRVVAELLGHRDLGTVHRYVGVRDERKIAAMDSLG